jgi:hypothetical protein
VIFCRRDRCRKLALVTVTTTGNQTGNHLCMSMRMPYGYVPIPNGVQGVGETEFIQCGMPGSSPAGPPVAFMQYTRDRSLPLSTRKKAGAVRRHSLMSCGFWYQPLQGALQWCDGNLINLLISEDPPVAATVRQIAPSTPGPPNCARSIVGFEAARNLRASS